MDIDFKKIISIAFIMFGLAECLQAQGLELELNDVGHRQLSFAGFSLETKKAVHIEAVGAGADRWVKKIQNYQQDEYNQYAYAWILNAKTREMVWRMTVDNTEEERWSDWKRRFKGDVVLDRGDYELYFSAVEPDYFSFEGGFLSFDKIIKKIFRDEDWWDDHSDDWMVKVSGVDEIYNEEDVRKFQRTSQESAIIDLTNSKNDVYEKRGFSLSKPATVELYAVGEGYDRKMYDYGWIIEAKTRKKIWTMEEERCKYAGGAVKNKMIKQKLHLESGDYLVYFKTDDSHSSQKWNANPPYDPFSWGILVRMAEKNFDPSIISKYSEKEDEAIVSITKVGDYAYKEKSFEVKKPSKIRIYCIGEGRSGDMFDYGWISNAATGQIVWKMRYRDTQHAGGASKNRLFQGTIELDAGQYIVHYQSDDSHSYEDWNSRPPQDQDMYGISIYPVGDEKDIEYIPRKAIKSNEILAQLTHIGDDEQVRKQIFLDRPTRVRILCIGEGDWDEMYDYGWIENVQTGHDVWKMTYDRTEHAGGARKNRKVDTIITLDPGTYSVNYRSDDSHSYYDWNARPPRDEENWGITVYRLDN
jgi:hypothetical protein